MKPPWEDGKLRRSGDWYTYDLYHPQWGGYCGKARVEFSEVSGSSEGEHGCFELSVAHDGEFPTEEISFQRHCCDALQFVEFGLSVYEQMVSVQKQCNCYMPAKSGQVCGPVKLEVDTLREFRDRIDAILNHPLDKTPK